MAIPYKWEGRCIASSFVNENKDEEEKEKEKENEDWDCNSEWVNMCLFKTIHVEIPECRVYKQLIIPEKCWQVIRMKVFFSAWGVEGVTGGDVEEECY